MDLSDSTRRDSGIDDQETPKNVQSEPIDLEDDSSTRLDEDQDAESIHSGPSGVASDNYLEPTSSSSTDSTELQRLECAKKNLFADANYKPRFKTVVNVSIKHRVKQNVNLFAEKRRKRKLLLKRRKCEIMAKLLISESQNPDFHVGRFVTPEEGVGYGRILLKMLDDHEDLIVPRVGEPSMENWRNNLLDVESQNLNFVKLSK